MPISRINGDENHHHNSHKLRSFAVGSTGALTGGAIGNYFAFKNIDKLAASQDKFLSEDKKKSILYDEIIKQLNLTPKSKKIDDETKNILKALNTDLQDAKNLKAENQIKRGVNIGLRLDYINKNKEEFVKNGVIKNAEAFDTALKTFNKNSKEI